MPANVYLSEYNRILNIPNVQLIDAGRYQCTCVRLNGQSDSATVQLHVDGEQQTISTKLHWAHHPNLEKKIMLLLLET